MNGLKIVKLESIELLLRIGSLCNGAKLISTKTQNKIIGDPTEGSLIVLGKKGNIDKESLKNKYIFHSELPFDSERKSMTVIYDIGRIREAYVKGAPDILLNKCTRIIINKKIRKLSPADKKKILSINNDFAGNALRVLALAYREIPKAKIHKVESTEKDLIFVGLVGMIDPAREEVKLAIEQTHQAGIRTMIITGDHALTTKAVAQQIGLFEEGDLIWTGDDLEKLSDKELKKKIGRVRIIARALPIQKSRIVDALQSNGEIVAMTGDGVNDAPALKKADIGIAMGITGTDVAKEVSKAMLLDDNFATIVNAVREGRTIYDKIIKSTRYLLSCNAGEIIAVFIGILLFFKLPLLALQILIMNLLTDGLPAIGLSFEPSESDVMKRKPRNPKANPLTSQTLLLIVLFGLIMGIGTLFIFQLYVDISLRYAQTAAFTTLVMFEMFAVMSSKSLKIVKPGEFFNNKWLLLAVFSSISIQFAVLYIPFLQSVFETVPLNLMDWGRILLVSSLGYIVMEIGKVMLNLDKHDDNVSTGS